MQKIAIIRPKPNKIDEKPAKWCKIRINDHKPTNHYENNRKKHNRINGGRIALERLVGALINCSLLQSGGGGGGGEGELKWD